MTVSSQINKISYVGNGTTKEFAIPFYFFDESHIEVYFLSKGMEKSLEPVKDYSLTGAKRKEGGSLIMAQAPEYDEMLTILRVVPMTQEVDYRENEIFPSETHEMALDKLTMEVQQLSEKLTRTLTLSVTSNGNPDEIIPEIFRAEKNAVNCSVAASASAATALLEAERSESAALQAQDEAGQAARYAADIAHQALQPGLIVKGFFAENWTPPGWHACDGTEFSRDLFPDIYDNYLVCSPAKIPICSYAEYTAALSSEGQCACFAVDPENEKFRVPKINSSLGEQRCFVVLSNGAVNRSMADWSGYMSALDGKADRDAQNFSALGKTNILRYLAANYGAGISYASYINNSSGFYVPEYGWLWCRANNTGGGQTNVTIGQAIFILNSQANAAGSGSGSIFFVEKGTLVKVIGSNNAIDQLCFYPCKGVG